MTRIHLAAVLAAGFTLAACANSGASYEPIADGPTDAVYAQDLDACQAIATERGYINGDTRNNAMIGAGLGMLAGIADDEVNDTEGAITGAIVGAVAGAGATMIETRGERREIVVDCMKGRGHPVVG
ncbi:glycine zipper family protein [Hyphomonas jannaschiana]|uniref:glycine zipper family protein n=1 Tax=Hyphomonas jannaschiana TaxID=86 RepID=UPI0035C68C2A